MNFFGTIKRVVGLWFRKDGQDVKITPNSNSYSGTTDFQLPPKVSGSGTLVGESETQSLTNKTLVVSSNTITTAASGNLTSTELNAALSELQSDIDTRATSSSLSSHTGASTGVHGVTGAVVGTTDTQTLTNKTISASSNTISNIADSNIASGAAIDATKIGAGSVSNTEFGYLDGVTSSIQTQLGGKQSTSEKGQANGYASLDSGGKIPASQLPNSVMEYQGTWNAITNSPTLADGAGNAGDVYIVSHAFTRDLGSGSISFAVGDWAVYNGTTWQKSVNSNAVASVNGYTGAVTLTSSDIAEGSNLYFTNGRVDTQLATYKYSTTWTTGTTKSVTHNLGTRQVSVVIYDSTSFEELGVDSVVRTDGNTVDLTASEAPSGAGWTIVVSKA